MTNGSLINPFIALPELVQLGLTEAETKCYQLLVSQGARTAYEVATKLNMFPNAVYRLMQGLGEKGFVVKLETRPATFQPIPPTTAVTYFSQFKMKQIEELKLRAIERVSKTGSNKPETQINVLTGRNAMFSTYLRLAKDATKEILIISIGESVNDDTKLVNRDCIERGVAIKLIAHRYDKSNEQLLKNWVAMGVEVKHVPDWGFHLVICDGKQSIFAINNPTRTEERLSLLIDNKGLSSALRTYFFTLWKKAKPIG